MFQKSAFFLTLLLFLSCGGEKLNVELIIHNADIFTVDAKNSKAEALAVADGKIIFIGKSKDVLRLKNRDTKVIDARKNFVMPGFIEGHGHFSGLGFQLLNLDLLKVKNWDEVIAMVAEKVKTSKKGDWIEGRGWHQEKWNTLPADNVQGYPIHDALSNISPDNPVILFHASGHALFANEKAMQAAGITAESMDVAGGRIVRNKARQVIGVFEENAMDAIKTAYENYKATLNRSDQEKRWYEAIAMAQKECIDKGITSFQDAGSHLDELSRYRKMAENRQLDLRLWVMARENFETLNKEVSKYKVVGAGNGFYTCNAIKSQVDGALGAFGAWLLKPYADKPGFTGQNTTDIYEIRKMAELAIKNNMQFCVHAIGDRANRVVLDIYEGMAQLNKDKKDLRWRIEHAQHLHPTEIPRFAKAGIIASMQGIHCTSDAPFVVKRLGEERSKYGAYPWRSLLQSGVKIANGTDTPVEDVDPIKNFYATVTRKYNNGRFAFFPEQKMSRLEAIKSYTINNAFAAKEEKSKGSLEIGKYADIVILSRNLLKCRESDLLKTKVLFTIVNGKIKKH